MSVNLLFLKSGQLQCSIIGNIVQIQIVAWLPHRPKLMFCFTYISTSGLFRSKKIFQKTLILGFKANHGTSPKLHYFEKALLTILLVIISSCPNARVQFRAFSISHGILQKDRIHSGIYSSDRIYSGIYSSFRLPI